MKSPFQFWEENGKLIFEQGDARIYRIRNEDYLFVGQTMYASTQERDWYIKNVLPWAKGNVLEIGLGLGCASKVILSSNRVRRLLTIENNENVIAAFGRPLPRHLILLADVYSWAEKISKEFQIYDLIFVDHYTVDGEETIEELKILRTNLVPLLKEGGRIVFWVDENAPEEDKKAIRDLSFTKE